jgi:hypothetical protein
MFMASLSFAGGKFTVSGRLTYSTDAESIFAFTISEHFGNGKRPCHPVHTPKREGGSVRVRLRACLHDSQRPESLT